MKILYWIIGIAAIVGVVFLLLASGVPELTPPLEPGIINPVDHTKGLASSTVVVTEYSDFQCPACKSYYPIFRQLVQEYGDRVTFVYRHFPLTGIHPNAEFAARAAEAAGKQGKFWEMHDLLFEKQNEWEGASDIAGTFKNYAKLLDLSVEQFDTDWRSKEVKNLVTAERVHALKIGLQGTPSFFINGVQIQNPSSLEMFRQIIQSALKK